MRDLRDLFDEDRYFNMPTGVRLAVREFGTCLGIRTATAGGEWDARADKIISHWEAADVLHESDGEVSRRNAMDELQPISLVMYAAALMAGAVRKGSL